MSSTRTEVQVTVKGNGFTADFYSTRNLDQTTFVKAIKGKKGADAWLARETTFAARSGLTEKPFAETHLALVSQNGTDKAAPVWVVGWTTEEA